MGKQLAGVGLLGRGILIPPAGDRAELTLELETKVHTKVRNHREGPFYGLLLVESAY